MLSITDRTSSQIIKIFTKTEKAGSYGFFKPGASILVNGTAKYDTIVMYENTFWEIKQKRVTKDEKSELVICFAGINWICHWWFYRDILQRFFLKLW